MCEDGKGLWEGPEAVSSGSGNTCTASLSLELSLELEALGLWNVQGIPKVAAKLVSVANRCLLSCRCRLSPPYLQSSSICS